LNTRFLRTLCAVAETGSLAGAARAIGLSSAAVAEQVQALERDLGVRLITRLGRAVSLTDEGRAVVGAGREILMRVADLTQVAQLGRLSGTLRIGSVSTALMSVVPPTLRHMAGHHPEIALKIVPGTSAQLLLMLDSHVIDCAITVRPAFEVAKEFGWHPIREEPLTLVYPAEFPFGGVEACLASSPMISMHRNSPTGRIAERFLRDRTIVAKELFEIEAAEVILVLVSQGLGVSLLPDYGFTSSEERRIRKVAVGGRAYGRPVGILYRRGARTSLVDAFHAAIMTVSGGTTGHPARPPEFRISPAP
jgi:DNA-binding transcriptional LysR family regulator